MSRCGRCAAALPAGAAWCPQCFATTTAAAGMPQRPGPAAEALTVSSRWRKSPTTFGPVGRVAATVGLLIPLLVMVVGGFAVMFSWGGAAVYAAVVLPWGLRDVWRAGRVPAA